MKKHLTLAILRDGGFDENQYEILVEKLGPDYSDETPLKLSKILELTSISPCLRAFQYFDEQYNEVLKKIAVKLAVYCSADVLPIYEKKYPHDEKPRAAIAAARAWLAAPNDETARAAYAAAETAYAAAYAAGQAAAYASAKAVDDAAKYAVKASAYAYAQAAAYAAAYTADAAADVSKAVASVAADAVAKAADASNAAAYATADAAKAAYATADAADASYFAYAAYAIFVSKAKYAQYLKTLLEKYGF